MITATKEITTAKSLSIAELSAIYDRIYDIADRLIKKHNPCNIHKEITPHHLFPTKSKEETVCMSYCIGSLCCVGCGKWAKGCTVKALGCKLFLCTAVKNKILKNRFRILREIGRKHLSFTYQDSWGKQNYSVVDKYYVSKEDWLNFMENNL